MKLADTTFLFAGLVCGICCFTIHRVGSSDPTIPISIEYAHGNPLAIVFIWSAWLVSVAATLIYYRRTELAEALLSGAAATGILLIATTDHSSTMHGFALFVAVSALVVAPTINMLRRDDIGFGMVAVFATNLALTFVLVLLAVFAEKSFGPGMAERIWFLFGYVITAWVLDVPGIAAFGKTER